MIENIRKRARGINKHRVVRIVFPEQDSRVNKAIQIIEDENIAKVITLKDRRIEKNLEKAELMLHNNEADAIITGASHSSSMTLYLAFKFMAPEVKRTSGAFLMISPDKKSAMLFADCAAQPEPNPEQLAEIAELSAKTFKLITKTEPVVAMLSYSTKDSGKGLSVDNVREAVKILKQTDLNVEGEIQADAALNLNVARMKGAKALAYNVLIFPCLDAGNIGYKLVERFAGWHAIGPILQGLNKPVNDLSRGCSIQDIVNLAAITVLQVDELRKKKK